MGLTFSVLISVQKRDGAARHDCRDGVLVDKLRMPVAPKKNAKIVEPGYDPLKLDAIDEKDRERSLVFPYVIEKGVL